MASALRISIQQLMKVVKNHANRYNRIGALWWIGDSHFTISMVMTSGLGAKIVIGIHVLEKEISLSSQYL